MGGGTSKKGQVKAICARSGCTNPTWNGQPGEFCSKQCRPQSALCAAGCGKPSWNGQQGEYCSQSCRKGGGGGNAASCPGCGKPSWNGQPGEYCSQHCKVSTKVSSTACPNCGKPSWNGKPGEYCSKACKSGTVQGGADGFLCLRPGCGNFSYKGLPGEYCSPTCRDLDPPICMQMGCGKPTWNLKLNDYCSKVCRDTRICVRPGCGKPTWNGTPNEFCSRRCRKLGPPHMPVAPATPADYTGPQSTLMEISNPAVLAQFQDFLHVTHKGPPNNWTRDRGCTIHGVGDPNCSISCAWANKVPVPSGYEVIKVEMNMNPTLWGDYVKARDAIVQDCDAPPTGSLPYFDLQLETSGFPELGKVVGSQPMVDECNEWRLLHGTSRQACEGICESNFAVNLAGTGATWKPSGQGKGVPLYGYGVYLAERITKADEYAREEGPDGNLCSVLVCRVVGGRAHIITTNHIDIDKLQQDVTSGRCDSVVGDRVTILNKPFKEVVVYNCDQVLPEFIITYKRL